MAPIHYWLPSWAPMAALVIFGHIFAKRGVSQVVLDHEAVHVEQQRRDGLLFYLRYIFLPSRRVAYEAEAYVVDLSAGRDIFETAAVLAGPLYLWPCSQEKALTALCDAIKARGAKIAAGGV